MSPVVTGENPRFTFGRGYIYSAVFASIKSTCKFNENLLHFYDVKKFENLNNVSNNFLLSRTYFKI